MKPQKTLCRDLVMKELIKKYGELTLAESSDYFTDLVRSIVGQQLSGKAANTIWKRVEALLSGEINADNFLSVPDELMRQAGVSGNKTRYIKNIAQAVMNKSLDLENIRSFDNEEIIRQLTTIKGVGQWTAEMFLIFSLAREDVFSFGDGGLNSAINKLYGSGVVLTKDEIKTISEKWKPYRSIACLYLWQSLDNKNFA
jgi:DNA-3-methyladenine glycosylase II